MPAPTHKASFYSNERYLDILAQQDSVVWKRFSDGHELRMYLFMPEGHSEQLDIPSVLFYHGGMWMTNNIAEIVPWALQLAENGVACLLPEYRTRHDYELMGEDILQEGIEAWEWLSEQASALGVDPANITLAGADAGGLMALHAGMPLLPEHPRWQFWKGRPLIPRMPAAIALFRGVIDVLAPESQMLNLGYEMRDTKMLNPINRLRKKLPPLFCAHGVLDPLQDVDTTDWFCFEWSRLGNEVESYLAPRGDHTLMSFHVNPQSFELIHLNWSHYMQELGLWPRLNNSVEALML